MDFLDFAKTTLCLITAGFVVAVVAWGFVYFDTKSMQRDLQQLEFIKEQTVEIQELSHYVDTLQVSVIELQKNEIDKQQEKIDGKKKK